MKIFITNEGTDGESINFVDGNNVVVGFEYAQQCGECFGYIITPELTEEELAPYVFDTTYIEFPDPSVPDANDNYDNRVQFRLTFKDKEIFLTLTNWHNGYYSHGFTFTNGSTLISKGFF